MSRMKNTTNEDCCSLCQDDRVRMVLSGEDMLFGVPGVFHVGECLSCGLWRLTNPVALDDLSKIYPDGYSPYMDHRPINKVKKLRLSHYLRQWYFLWMEKGRPSIFHLPLSELAKTILSIMITPFQTFRFNPFAFGVNKKKILDIGCADGHFLSEMAQLGWEPFGIEMKSEAIARARERNIEIFPGIFPDIPDLNDLEKTFDLLTMRQVLEHFRDPFLALKAANAMLKPGGFLCLWVPVTGGLVPRVFKRYWYNLDLPRHMVLFNKKTLTAMLHQSGFSVENTMAFSSTKAITKSFEAWYFSKSNGKENKATLSTQFVNALALPITKILDLFGMGDNLVVVARKVEKVFNDHHPAKADFD